jgi:hypothetical protein
MKTIAFGLLLSFFAFVSYGQSATPEESAIKAVIAAETQAFDARNYEQWAAHWAQEESTSLLAANGADRIHATGWAEVGKAMKDFMAANATPQHPDRSSTNFRAQIGSDLAWVFFDQKTDATLGWEQRTLKKVGGAWKLVSVVVVNK